MLAFAAAPDARHGNDLGQRADDFAVARRAFGWPRNGLSGSEFRHSGSLSPIQPSRLFLCAHRHSCCLNIRTQPSVSRTRLRRQLRQRRRRRQRDLRIGRVVVVDELRVHAFDPRRRQHRHQRALASRSRGSVRPGTSARASSAPDRRSPWGRRSSCAAAGRRSHTGCRARRPAARCRTPVLAARSNSAT